jgi:hypothetical protein
VVDLNEAGLPHLQSNHQSYNKCKERGDPERIALSIRQVPARAAQDPAGSFWGHEYAVLQLGREMRCVEHFVTEPSEANGLTSPKLV